MVRASINLRNILDISETKQQVDSFVFCWNPEVSKIWHFLKSIVWDFQISLETTLRFLWFDIRLKPTQSALQALHSFQKIFLLQNHVMQTIGNIILHIYAGNWYSWPICKSTTEFCQQDLDARYLHWPGKKTKTAKNVQTIFKNQGNKPETADLLYQTGFFEVSKRNDTDSL